MPVSMVVHGGAWSIPDDLVDAHAEGCLRALNEGFRLLKEGAPAVDAVVAAIRILEDDPTFDAGKGSFLTCGGEVELDASLMDGTTLNIGAVACVKRVAQPIHLARLVLNSPHVLLVGEGADRFAEEQGMELCDGADLVIERERQRWQALREAGQWQASTDSGFRDTVGAVALDARGNIVAGLSTGGTPDKVPGRVGDVPQAGCGFYADSAVGGVACTGWGESIVRVGLAHRAMSLLEKGLTPQNAAERAIELLARKVDGSAGIIILDSAGNVGTAFNTKRMARAFITRDMDELFVAVDQAAWRKGTYR